MEGEVQWNFYLDVVLPVQVAALALLTLLCVTAGWTDAQGPVAALSAVAAVLKSYDAIRERLR